MGNEGLTDIPPEYLAGNCVFSSIDERKNGRNASPLLPIQAQLLKNRIMEW